LNKTPNVTPAKIEKISEKMANKIINKSKTFESAKKVVNHLIKETLQDPAASSETKKGKNYI